MKPLNLQIFIISLLLLINYSLKSQIIGGKVVQIHDQRSIPYTTLAIEGTTLGIVSDFDGNFVFEFPGKHLTDNLIVTCVGFKDKTKKYYYFPTDKNYAKTKINPDYGERWFCSPIEATEAGWKRFRFK